MVGLVLYVLQPNDYGWLSPDWNQPFVFLCPRFGPRLLHISDAFWDFHDVYYQVWEESVPLVLSCGKCRVDTACITDRSEIEEHLVFETPDLPVAEGESNLICYIEAT